MKKIAFIILLVLIPFLGFGQQKSAKVTLRNGTVVEGLIKEFDPLDHITIVIAGSETTIPMSQVAYVGNNSEKTTEVVKEKVVAEDQLADFKGFLLAKGNNVYVFHANSDGDKEARYDRAGAEVIIEALKKDGFWNVVDNMIDAHFTLNYIVQTTGSDLATLTVSSWRTGKSLYLQGKRSNESYTTNVKVANNFYQDSIVDLQKDISEGKVSKKILEYFTIE